MDELICCNLCLSNELEIVAEFDDVAKCEDYHVVCKKYGAKGHKFFDVDDAVDYWNEYGGDE